MSLLQILLRLNVLVGRIKIKKDSLEKNCKSEINSYSKQSNLFEKLWMNNTDQLIVIY